MANIKSEQLTSNLNLEIALDQPLSSKQMSDEIIKSLGIRNISFIKVDHKNIPCYKNKIVFLTAAVTYLGGTGQHPIFKKRIQLQPWWKKFVKDHPQYDVRFLGIYHYKKNIVFIDFIKDTYLKRKMNNSSAFVYTNDFYQAMKKGIYSRTDVKGNERKAIKYTSFKKYIEGKTKISEDIQILKTFDDFNSTFKFNRQITIIDALKIMLKTKDLHVIRETEWAGFYLENRMKTYIAVKKVDDIIKYVGKSNKKKGELDFDLWFDSAQFYGDLKASDIKKRTIIGNDKSNFFESINRYDKFWYVIYEHETQTSKQASLMREAFLKSHSLWKEPKAHKKPVRYHRELKHRVCFKKMIIVELNRINCNKVLSDYNQGSQPSGAKRKLKVSINKSNMENYVVYSYSK